MKTPRRELVKQGLKRVSKPDILSGKRRTSIVIARPETNLDIRKHPNTKVRGSSRNKTGRGKRIIGERPPLKNTTFCPRCKINMDYVETIVEHDERSFGDEFDGDFEQGTCATQIYKCPECGRESEIDLGFKGSGLLR